MTTGTGAQERGGDVVPHANPQRLPSDIPHACEPDREPDGEDGGPRRPRLLGVDAARGLALFGMVAVHVFTADAGEGSVSLPWLISSGTSSATFAVLGGVGLAFMSGRTTPERAPRRTTLLRLATRAVLVLAIGLLLGAVIPVDTAGVILPYLGLLFLMAGPVLWLRPRVLFALAFGALLLSPVLSHLIRREVPAWEQTNIVLGDLLTEPVTTVLALAVTGLYPALTWFTYLLLGIGLGRVALESRRYAVGLAGLGAALALTAVALSWLLLGPLGGLERLARDVSGTMTLDTFTALLTWGGDGSFPATSWWWLISDAPHTGTQLDLLRTSGVALLVLGLCLMVASALPSSVLFLSAPGSMTLTLYWLHLLLLLLPLGAAPELLVFAFQVLVLTGFGLAWQRSFGRGPVESVVASACRWVAPSPGRHRLP